MTKRRMFDYRFVPRRERALILACMLFWSIISYELISRYVLRATLVVGTSMEPGLRAGERRIVKRWPLYFRDPHRGEIIAFRLPQYDSLSVKRVIALPGDTVQVLNGRVYVRGRPVEEPYLQPGCETGAWGTWSGMRVLEAERYFVLGDNRGESLDSRMFGPVRREWIVGML